MALSMTFGGATNLGFHCFSSRNLAIAFDENAARFSSARLSILIWQFPNESRHAILFCKMNVSRWENEMFIQTS
jgi:hypothetical protein